MAYLIIQEKDGEPRFYEIKKSSVTIGRRKGNDICLSKDENVSRDHAKILEIRDGVYEIIDLGAKNYMKVNQEIVSQHELKDGDKITLGNSDLVFKAEGDPAKIDYAFDNGKEALYPGFENTVIFSSEEIKSLEFEILRKDHQKLMIFYDFIRSVNSNLDDPGQLLDEILNTAMKVLNAEQGLIALNNENTSQIEYRLAKDKNGDIELSDIKASEKIIQKVFKEGSSILASNAAEEDGFRHISSVIRHGIQSVLCAPLICNEGVIGVVYLDNRNVEGAFSENELAFLTSLGQNAGIALNNIRLHRQLINENILLRRALDSENKLIGVSEKMKTIYGTAKKVANSDASILLRGETGTGKDVVAKSIHTMSPRSEKPYISVDCGSLPGTLFESELFGYEKNAFTGAYTSRKGRFELANGGTVFLNEIGNISLEMQAKLLSILDNQELWPLGADKPIKIDVRIIAATNKDLEKMIQQREFMEDLYYRLNTITIQIPPLRDRKEDIIPLAEHFLAGRASLSARAKNLLVSYYWPGNVRELKQCIERGIILGNGKNIQPDDLPHEIRSNRTPQRPFSTLKEVIEELEKEHIIKVLNYTKWHKMNAANILEISRQTLDDKIDKYQIPKDDL